MTGPGRTATTLPSTPKSASLLSKMRELACSASSSIFTAKRTGGSSKETEGSTYGFPLPDDSTGEETATGFDGLPFVGAGGGVGRLMMMGGSAGSSSSSSGPAGSGAKVKTFFVRLSFFEERAFPAIG